MHITILHLGLRNRAPFRHANACVTAPQIRQEEMDMTEQQERLAKERAEIAARVARFKATQEKFERERDEYFVATLRNARATGPLPFWT